MIFAHVTKFAWSFEQAPLSPRAHLVGRHIAEGHLEKLDDFASIEVFEKEGLGRTVITAEQLKGFVRRELRLDRRKVFVRNIWVKKLS